MKLKKSRTFSFLGSTKLEQYEFANGLKLLVLEKNTAPVFSYQTWFNVGSRDEEPGKSGLAHLFEHMMFKGTKKMPQGTFDRAMESAGARDLNAFTSTDYTAYVASLPVEFIDLVANLEADRMVGLALTKSQFDSEREVVHNERKQRLENNPEGLMFEELQRLAFQSHPYGRPIIGFADDLDRMSVADCEAFYQSHYAPNNAVICVVGGIKGAKVAQVIEKYYGKIPSALVPNVQPPKEKVQDAERVSVLSLPLQVEKTYIGFKIPEARHAHHAALAVMSTVLSTGRSSRLYRAMVDSGITIDASISTGGQKDPALAYAGFTSQQGRRAEEAIDAFDKVMAQLIEEGPTESELERAKNKIRTDIFTGLMSNSSIAHFLGQNHLVMGSVQAALEEIDQISKIKAPEVVKVASLYINKNNRSIVVGKPA